MQDFQSFLAPAKINLFLHITGQRADGYHLLQTVFCLLDLYDTVKLKPSTDGVVKRVNDVAGVPAAIASLGTSARARASGPARGAAPAPPSVNKTLKPARCRRTGWLRPALRPPVHPP